MEKTNKENKQVIKDLRLEITKLKAKPKNPKTKGTAECRKCKLSQEALLVAQTRNKVLAEQVERLSRPPQALQAQPPPSGLDLAGVKDLMTLQRPDFSGLASLLSAAAGHGQSSTSQASQAGGARLYSMDELSAMKKFFQ